MSTDPTNNAAPAAPHGAAAGDAYEQLVKMVAAASEDYQKAVGGNKAAGTRVRKAMQDVKSQAQAIRLKVLQTRSTTP